MKKEQHVEGSMVSPLRVRIGGGYALKFIMLHGQRNARFVQRRFFPLHRFFRWGDAVTFVSGMGIDLIHSFNGVPLLTRRPYVVTFEDFMPRVPEDRYVLWLERWLQKELCHPRCRAIIAMSEYARRQCLWQNRSFARLSILKEKLFVIHPTILLKRQEPKRLGDVLRLIFVGGDYMRKGLPALLKAHQELRAKGIPVLTTVVSSLNWNKDDYVGPPSKAYVDDQRRLLSQDGIEYHPFTPYDNMLRLVTEAHFMVFPTLHDTFGFVSLDALACATPVLATATCAQPEIIEDGQCGYLLPFDNDSNIGKWVWLYRNRDPGYLEAYDETIKVLARAITDRLVRCWQQRDQYERLSAGAIRKVTTQFHPDIARDRLEALYERCRDGNVGAK